MIDECDLFSDVSDIYFEADEITSLRPPTLLYPLEPFGIGTRSAESLESYILRLASAHCVTPHALYKFILSPLLSIHCLAWRNHKSTIGIRRPGCWNGYGLMANTLAMVLAEATSVEKLRYSSLGGLEDLISEFRLFRKEVVFCPTCLEEAPDFTKYYIRLLWSISAVEVCPIHKIALIPQVCGSSARQEGLSQKTLFGICSHCGSVGYKCNTTSSSNANEVQIWRATQIGELIAQSPSFYKLFTKESLKKGIAATIDALGDGYLTPAAKAAGLNKSILWGWLNNKCRPSLHLLLNLCGAANVSLLSVMKGEPEKSALPGAGILKRDVKVWRLPKPSQKARENALHETLLAEVPRSIQKLAKELGITEKCLRNDFPVLAQKITERRRQYRAETAAVKFKQATVECSAAILELERAGKPVTFRNFQMQLNRNILPKSLLYKAFKAMVSPR